MTRAASMRQRFRYKIDTFLARGTGALFVSLLVAFLGAIALFAILRLVLMWAGVDTSRDALAHAWTVFLELTASGNMNQDNQSSPTYKAVAVASGLTGVIIFSSLIAFLTNALNQAIGHLQKGHSKVLESDHKLILGWSPRVIEILRELVEANESEDDPCVVLLCEHPKEEIDEYLRKNFTDRRNTRLVTRSGPTASLNSLEWVSADAASGAIVLADCTPAATADDKAASDAKVIKTVLAIDALTKDNDDLHVVAELYSPRNRGVVANISPGKVAVVDAEEILAKIMVQTSRTSGLAVVYSELLSFEGCEMYFYGADWGDITFGQLQFHFPDGVPLGVRTEAGELLVRPDVDRPMDAGDEVLIVAEDDSTIEFLPQPVMVPQELDCPQRRLDQHKERQLVLGWSAKAPIIISEYAEYVLEGSEIDVLVLDPPEDVIDAIADLDTELDNVRVRWINKDPLLSEDLESMKPFDYNNVVVLPQRPGVEVPAERTDAETIVVLLHLRKLRRELEAQGHNPTTRLLTEVLESQNRELVWTAGVNDFIISNRMVSMIFAQLSEEPEIQRVYDDLFEEDGSEIYVKPAHLYFDHLPTQVRFGDLMRLTQKRDAEVCIGVKLDHGEGGADNNYGVKLIPEKNTPITIRPGDSLVVLAEDDR